MKAKFLPDTFEFKPAVLYNEEYINNSSRDSRDDSEEKEVKLK